MRTHQHAQKITFRQKTSGHIQVNYGGTAGTALANNPRAAAAFSAAGSPYPIPARIQILNANTNS